VKLLDEKHVVESDTLPAPLTGREAGRQFMQMYVSAFPDLHFDIDQIFGEGDYVATRLSVRAQGKNGEELMAGGINISRDHTAGHSHLDRIFSVPEFL
jgi:predicted ester cyclase